MKKKIIIFANYFCAWDGGVDIFKHWLSCINSLKKKKLELIVVLPKNNVISLLKKIAYPYFFFIKNFFFEKKMIFKKWPYWQGATDIGNYIKLNLNKNIQIIYSDYSQKKKLLDKYNGQIFFPSIDEVLSKNSLGYIFDLQHEYLNKNFSKNEIKIRRKKIKNLFNLNKVLVNSYKTKKDLLNFHKNFKRNQISVIPFAPSEVYFRIEKNTKNNDFFFKNFYIVCNKFWKHKNHITVLKAFSIYKKSGGKNNLLFTGDNKDLRSKKIIDKIERFIIQRNLSDYIKITGRLSKQDQLSLLNNSKALIQPTLFEGGPGGGSVYDAIALDKPVIISDIDINKEIKYNKLLFFNPNNYKDLNKKLFFFEKKYFKKNQNNFLKTNLNLRKKCGKFLLNAFSYL